MVEPVFLSCTVCHNEDVIPEEEARLYNKNNPFVCKACKTAETLRNQKLEKDKQLLAKGGFKKEINEMKKQQRRFEKKQIEYELAKKHYPTKWIMFYYNYGSYIRGIGIASFVIIIASTLWTLDVFEKMLYGEIWIVPVFFIALWLMFMIGRYGVTKGFVWWDEQLKKYGLKESQLDHADRKETRNNTSDEQD